MLTVHVHVPQIQCILVLGKIGEESSRIVILLHDDHYQPINACHTTRFELDFWYLQILSRHACSVTYVAYKKCTCGCLKLPNIDLLISEELNFSS